MMKISELILVYVYLVMAVRNPVFDVQLMILLVNVLLEENRLMIMYVDSKRRRQSCLIDVKKI